MTISPGPATSSSIRDAVLTTSPSTVNSRRLGDPMSPVSATPVLIAIRICSFGPSLQRVEVGERVAHRDRRLDRVQRVIGLIERRAEHREQRVAQELVERALVLEDDVGHPREERVEQRGRLRPAAAARRAS